MNQTFTPMPARSWRDIPQNVTPRAMSREGRKRLVLAVGNIVGIALVLIAAIWGVYEIIVTWQHSPTRITAPVKSEPLREIALRTDGVLDLAWVERTLALRKGVTLMELDLPELKRRLQESGQVRTAVVGRDFPDKLRVVLQERSPVVRVLAQIPGAAAQTFLVARDGEVYSGAAYAPALVEALPFLDGVKLVRSGAGFATIEGLDQVADLLGAAHANTPAIYRSFRIVSLARYASDRVILVKSVDVQEITFGLAADGFYKQLARLDYILDETRRQTSSAELRSINLAVGTNQVPVAFGPPQSLAEAKSVPSSVRPGLSGPFFPLSRNSSSSKRDF